MSERQTPNTALDPRCQSGPSARNSVVPGEGGFSGGYGRRPTTTADFRSSFWQIHHVSNVRCWKIRFKTVVCTCSQFLTEAMLLIKEVEMVESVDDLKSSCSVRGIQMPNFEVLDAKIASALNPIIHKTRFKRKVSLEEGKAQKRGPLSPRITDHFPDLRVVPGHWSQRFCRELCRPIYNWSTKWRYSGIRFEMGRNLIINDENPIWWHLGKLVQNSEYESLRNLRPCWNFTIWRFTRRKKAGPDYLRLKTMVKRSIGQNLRIENFEARNGNYERNAVVKNQGRKQREQRSLGDCWQWKAYGQCSKGDNCSFRHDINKRGKITQSHMSPISFMQQNERNASRTRSPRGRSLSGRMLRLPCKDYLKGTCTNLFCEKWHPPECLFYKSEKGCRFGEKCSYAHRQVDEQPSKRSKKNGDKSAVAMLKKEWDEQIQWTGRPVFGLLVIKYTTIGLRISGYGAAEVFIDSRKTIRRVKFTSAVVRHANIRDQSPSLGMICPGDPHQRHPNAPKFEDRSQEETERQERCARAAAWRLAKSILKLKG